MENVLRQALALGDYRLGVSFLLGWFCLEALDPQMEDQRILQLRDHGADRQVEIINTYHGRGIRGDLLLIILYQKLRFLAAAKTLQDARDIIRPSMPHYRFGEFTPSSRYYVEEEELVLWSLFSAEHVLPHEGKIRALALFDHFLNAWGSCCWDKLDASSDVLGKSRLHTAEPSHPDLEET